MSNDKCLDDIWLKKFIFKPTLLHLTIGQVDEKEWYFVIYCMKFKLYSNFEKFNQNAQTSCHGKSLFHRN